jgi:hypothetical protein
MVLHDLYAIYNLGGRCIYHYKFGGLEIKSDLICPFLDALSAFAMETIPSQGKIRLLDKEDVKILFERGDYVTLALLASESSSETRGLLSLFLSILEQDYASVLKNWNGDLNAFSALDVLVESVFKREKTLQKPIPRDLQKSIHLSDVAGSRMNGKDALSIIRTAIQDGVSGIISVTLDPLKFDPIGYISILRGKGYAALYAKYGDMGRTGDDAARHIIFDSLTLPAWLKFREARDNEIEIETDRTANRIEDPLYKIALDTLLLRQRYDDIRDMKPKSKKELSADDIHSVNTRFGDVASDVLNSSNGTIKLDELASAYGLSTLEVTELIVWAVENGIIELVRN